MKVFQNRRCSKESYVKGERVGALFSIIVPMIKKRIISTDDNCTILCFGATGSGKSTLGYHFGNLYNDGAGVDSLVVGFDSQSWALALDAVKDKSGSFLMHDEANISKRDSMSQFNKDTIDLLFSIRSKNLCLWMNNPSADYLDKVFLDDSVVNYFVFIYAKQRRYYWFTRTNIISMLKHVDNLKYSNVKQYGKHFAFFDGYFYKYKGADWDSYLVKKSERVDNKLDEYIAKYSKGAVLNVPKAAQALNVGRETLRGVAIKALSNGDLSDNVKTLTGFWQFNKDDLEVLRGYLLA